MATVVVEERERWGVREAVMTNDRIRACCHQNQTKPYIAMVALDVLYPHSSSQPPVTACKAYSLPIKFLVPTQKSPFLQDLLYLNMGQW